MKWTFVFVVFVHLFLLLYEVNEKNHVDKYKSKKQIKITFHKLDNKKIITVKNLLPRGLTLGDLKAGINSYTGVAGPNDSGLSFRLHQVLNSYIQYPQEFSEAEIQGCVQFNLYFDKNGSFKEEHSIFNGSNNYLKVYVARSIRNALKNKLFQNNDKKAYKFTIIVKYVLSTSRTIQSESFLLDDNNLMLVRKAYGVSNGKDKLIKGIERTITHISNIFTLFEYLPDTKKVKLKKRKYFESLENDKAW